MTPEPLAQDLCAKLSRWLSATPEARRMVREKCSTIQDATPMTRPKRSDAYPPQFLHALQRVAETGEPLTVPTDSPIAMRLSFYGLFGALRAEGKPELPAMVSIFIPKGENCIIIRPKDDAPLAQDLAKALASPVSPPPGDDYESALARILGEKS